MWIKQASCLNVYTGEVEQVNIYLSGSRIAYVGAKELTISADTEIVELKKEQVIVPGYIEPHAHPCQMYNPFTWGEALLQQGTVLSINDNFSLITFLGNEALQFVEKLEQISDHMFLWWSNIDRPDQVTPKMMEDWFRHNLVIQSGELTEWPKLLDNDKILTEQLYLVKAHHRMRAEGHLPGVSSEKIITMAAAGITADHESLHADDVLRRLKAGLYVSLRYSSIRPDLPDILKGMKGDTRFNMSRMMLTSDGPSPNFVEKTSFPSMIKICLEAGISVADAYRFATLNPAVYYGLEEDLGGIAPGRLACLNVLSSISEPVPIHVLQRGQWMVRDYCRVMEKDQVEVNDWLRSVFPSRREIINLTPDQMETRTGTGIELINDVITQPYYFDPCAALETDENWLTLLDANGSWVINTRIKGFASGVKALASTYNASNDTLLLGRSLSAMREVSQEMSIRGEGILIYFIDGEQLYIPLSLSGAMSTESIALISARVDQLNEKMRFHGYRFGDPLYSLLFLTASHLPYIRLSNKGLYLVKTGETLVSTVPLG
ncbi:adenine deaminase C-terminal domain-containing protein [Paenibacillus silvae]|uniref:adenine deaminase C-terminal domain-containing protein n=1 Tax=Paenibacillus TaxID=44249 RepID=UPI001C11BB34|nr:MULTISPECIES: adenine deaminase C-terminal domain-containing protein [Paenibacillus]MBU5354500.1 amidohydrolase family protein [Paenibacillus barcinonensis]MDM5281606.1 adenine deaminase C-terminal domain-containing protein [Paenibacillus silvae]